jgi:hypothetical protein
MHYERRINMAKYRKIPVVIEADVYKEGMEDGWRLNFSDEGNKYERFFKSKEGVERFIKDAKTNGYYDGEILYEDPVPIIKTLEGIHKISKGDYIITGVKGERYPCKPDIFKMTYEPADE